MNKQSFLTELERELAALTPAERKDVLRDMEEYFYEASQRGRSEEDVIKQLGSPKKLAESIIAEAKIKRIDTADTFWLKTSAIFGALFALILLAPINLIFVFVPFLIITFLLVLGWSVAIGITLATPIIWIALLLSLFFGFGWFLLLSFIFFVIGWSGLAFIAVIALFYLTIFYFKAIASWLRWNLQFIKNRMR